MMGIQAYSTTGKRIVKDGGVVSFYGKKYQGPWLLEYVGQEVFIRDYDGRDIDATTPDGKCFPISEKED